MREVVDFLTENVFEEFSFKLKEVLASENPSMILQENQSNQTQNIFCILLSNIKVWVQQLLRIETAKVEIRH